MSSLYRLSEEARALLEALAEFDDVQINDLANFGDDDLAAVVDAWVDAGKPLPQIDEETSLDDLARSLEEWLFRGTTGRLADWIVGWIGVHKPNAERRALEARLDGTTLLNRTISGYTWADYQDVSALRQVVDSTQGWLSSSESGSRLREGSRVAALEGLVEHVEAIVVLEERALAGGLLRSTGSGSFQWLGTPVAEVALSQPEEGGYWFAWTELGVLLVTRPERRDALEVLAAYVETRT